jgi:23S rRNA-/tRNA-specific pseudouridylate synthase
MQMNREIATATAHILFSPTRISLLPSFACSFKRPNYFNTPYEVKARNCRSHCSHFNIADDVGTISGSNCHTEHMMGTRYHVSSRKDQQKKWVYISFDDLDDTTSPQNAPKKTRKVVNKSTSTINQQALTTQQKKVDDTSCSINALAQKSSIPKIPDSVLQYQRQMRKIQAADRASKTNVNIDAHLRTVYFDDHIVVTDKPSGILCVPGVNKNRSLLDLVYEVYGDADPNADAGVELSTSFPRDSMIVHRLDMDTSGIVIFARTRASMSKLHEAFRDRTGAKKVYEALLVGWLDINQWIESAEMRSSDAIKVGDIESDAEFSLPNTESVSLGGGEISLPLQRDHKHPPFMRVSTPESESEARQAVKDLNHAGYSKLIAKNPKPSTTQFRILSHEHWMGYPVTRVALVSCIFRCKVRCIHELG